MDSNGPDVKIRGTAAHIFEKYQTLARDAQSAGDRVGAENYLQHAEHYYRLIIAAQQPGDGQSRLPQQGGHPGGQRLDAPEEAATAGGTDAETASEGDQNQGAGEASGGGSRQRSGNRRRRPRQESNGFGEGLGHAAPAGDGKADAAPAARDEDAAESEDTATV